MCVNGILLEGHLNSKLIMALGGAIILFVFFFSIGECYSVIEIV